jgi:hypothetical protein
MKKNRQNKINQKISNVYKNWKKIRKDISGELLDVALKSGTELESWWLFDCDEDWGEEQLTFTKYMLISFLQFLKDKRIVKIFSYRIRSLENFKFLEYYVIFDNNKFIKWYENEYPDIEDIDYKGDFFGSKELIQREFLKPGRRNKPETGELKVLAGATLNEDKVIKYQQVVEWYGSNLLDLELKDKPVRVRANEIISKIRKKLKSPYKFRPIEKVGWVFGK